MSTSMSPIRMRRIRPLRFRDDRPRRLRVATRPPAAAPWIAALSLFALLAVLPLPSAGQNFVAVTDTTNPINTTPPSGFYTGAAWVDMDNDGWLDLYVVRKRPVFRNAGGGVFEKMAGAFPNQGSVIGTSWSDYDNDGDIDCYAVGGPFQTFGSQLYRNDGNFTFVEVTDGDIGDFQFNTGWGCAWGDMDNDGFTDLVIAAADSFATVHHENRLLHNNGDGTLSHDFTTAVTESLDAHTIPIWSDYDQDGDMDIFIGSGEISSLTPDNLFRNTLVENGTPGFERITTAPIATDLVNGQNWNWIDYDNDGDFDAYQTNYGATRNNFYRNDGGTYVSMTALQIGPIVSNADNGLGNVWGDFDNDGDLDCIVTNDNAGPMDYFRNDGGVFSQVTGTALTTEPGPHYGSPIADYDRDGDLDLYVHSSNEARRHLWENQLANGNSWINLKLVGAGAPLSNVSAIGAKVRALATISGSPTWQLREVTAENGFNSMNALNVHFGLGDAAVIDTLRIEWPSGLVDVMTGVAVEQFLTVNETPPTGVPSVAAGGAAGSMGLARPNPFAASTELSFELAAASHVTLDVIDVTGRRVRTLLDEPSAPGAHRAVWDGRDADGRPVASGVYLMRMMTTDEDGSQQVRTRRTIRMR